MAKSAKSSSTKELQRRIIELCRRELLESKGLVLSRVKNIEFKEQGPDDSDYPHYYDVEFLAEHDPELHFTRSLQLKITCKLLVLKHKVEQQETFVFQLKSGSLTYSLASQSSSE